MHAVRHLDERQSERGRLRPAETHAHITGHVDDEASRSEGGKVLLGHEDQGRGGILQNAVTTMSLSARKRATGITPSSGVSAQVRSGVSASCPIWTIWVE